MGGFPAFEGVFETVRRFFRGPQFERSAKADVVEEDLAFFEDLAQLQRKMATTLRAMRPDMLGRAECQFLEQAYGLWWPQVERALALRLAADAHHVVAARESFQDAAYEVRDAFSYLLSSQFNLEEFVFSELEQGGDVVKAIPPVRFTPRWDETQHYLEAEVPEFRMHLHGRNRAEIIQDFFEQLTFVYGHYACRATADQLAPDAIELRATLRSRFSLVQS